MLASFFCPKPGIRDGVHGRIGELGRTHIQDPSHGKVSLFAPWALMQTVLLEIISGPQVNQRVWIRLGQIVRLGSAEPADVVIDSDRTLAAIHFSVGHSRAGCFVECLEQTASISVNGKRMQRSRLHDGDVLVAGETEFKAIVSNEMGPGGGRPSANASRLRTDPAIPEAFDGSDLPVDATNTTDSIASEENEQTRSNDAVPDSELVYQATQLSEVLWQLSTESLTEFSLSEIIRTLGGKHDCFVCGDSSILGRSDDVARENVSYRQLDEDVVIRQLSTDEVIQLFESPDICRVATIIFSSQPFDSVCQSVSRHLFSFRRPSIFATQICVATAGVARKLFSELVAVLIAIESQQWQVFTSVPVDHSWQELGLPNQPG